MRQFNHDDDDVDYDALRQSRANDRESIKGIRDSLKVDEEDLFAKLAAAAAAASPEQRQAAARKSALVNRQGGVTSRGRQEVDTSAYMNIPDPNERMGRSPTRMPAKYAEIVDTLDRFKFSNDEERRKRQIKIVTSALRTALSELVLEEVAVNTKTSYKGYAEKVVKAPGGLKVYFNFGDGKQFTVTAKGGFYGDETVCVHQNGSKVTASILRIEGEDYTDLSENFEINIAKINQGNA